MPNKVSETLAHPDWRSAMIEEMDVLTDNGTWDLVRFPAGKKVIDCRWVFKVEVNLDGSITRLKARLVAKGYAQTYGWIILIPFPDCQVDPYSTVFISGNHSWLGPPST